MYRITSIIVASLLLGSTARAEDAPPRPPAVTVLPFAALGDDDRTNWVGQAIRENLIAEINRAGMVNVPSNMPAEKVRGTIEVKTAVKIASDLRADVVIWGNFQMVDSEVRVTGQVADVASGNVIGSLKANGTLKQLFSIEDQLSDQVRQMLGGPTQAAPPAAPQQQAPAERPIEIQPAPVAAATYDDEFAYSYARPYAYAYAYAGSYYYPYSYYSYCGYPYRTWGTCYSPYWSSFYCGPSLLASFSWDFHNHSYWGWNSHGHWNDHGHGHWDNHGHGNWDNHWSSKSWDNHGSHWNGNGNSNWNGRGSNRNGNVQTASTHWNNRNQWSSRPVSIRDNNRNTGRTTVASRNTTPSRPVLEMGPDKSPSRPVLTIKRNGRVVSNGDDSGRIVTAGRGSSESSGRGDSDARPARRGGDSEARPAGRDSDGDRRVSIVRRGDDSRGGDSPSRGGDRPSSGRSDGSVGIRGGGSGGSGGGNGGSSARGGGGSSRGDAGPSRSAPVRSSPAPRGGGGGGGSRGGGGGGGPAARGGR